MTIDKKYPDRWIDVYDVHEGRFRCVIEDESTLDAQYGEYLASGKTKDHLIELTVLNGATIKLAISAIAGWMISTLAQAEENVRANRAFVNIMRETDPDFAAADD